MSFIPHPNNPVPQDRAMLNREAFWTALNEIGDVDVREQLFQMIDALARVFMEMGGRGRFAAEGQAIEFFSACVWNKVQGKKG